MKKLAIIGANEFQYPLIEKAKKLGYETHVFAWKTGALGEKAADIFYDISIVEKEKICEICKKENVDGVASIGSDVAVKTVNYILRQLGLPSNPEITDVIATNKYEMRNALKEAEIFVPNYCIADEKFSIDKVKGFRYPLIVKPTDRSGSRGIFKVMDVTSLLDAVSKAQKESFENKAIIEEFFEGIEYSCESISYEGKHTILAYTQKYTTGAPHFIETGHLQPCSFENQEKIDKTVIKCLDALQIKYGASHTEFRINTSGEIMIMEIGARMGGDCIGSDLVPLTTGFDYMKMVIDIGCGRPPVFDKGHSVKKAEIRFIFEQTDVDEYKKILSVDKQRIYRNYIPEDKVGGNIESSAERHGFFICTEE